MAEFGIFRQRILVRFLQDLAERRDQQPGFLTRADLLALSKAIAIMPGEVLDDPRIGALYPRVGFTPLTWNRPAELSRRREIPKCGDRRTDVRGCLWLEAHP